MIAHADHGAGGLGSLLLVVAGVLAGALWLVRLNRRLDDTEDPMPRRRYSTYEKLLFAGFLISLAAAVYVFTRPDHPPADAQVAIDGLCQAATQAETDTGAALDTFNDSPHGALHQLDSELRRKDPALALRLADAKAAAESALIDNHADAPALTAELADTMADAYETLGEDVDRCS